MPKNLVLMTGMGKMHKHGEIEALIGLMQNVVLYLHQKDLKVVINGKKV